MARTRSAATQNTVVSGEDQASVHEEMFRTLLRTPHRRIDECLQTHLAQFHRDPSFYGQLAIWATAMGNNTIRDIDEIFLAILFASEFNEHREAAYVMLQEFPPYRIERVAQYFTGYDERVKHLSFEANMPAQGEFGVTYEPAHHGKTHEDKAKRGKKIARKTVALGAKSKMRQELIRKRKITSGTKQFHVDTWLVHHECLGKRNIRGMLKRAIKSYLCYREKPENRGMMEGALLRARNVLHTLYFRSNTLPQGDENGWINQYIFRGIVEEGSRLEGLRFLSTGPLVNQKEAQRRLDIGVGDKILCSILKRIANGEIPAKSIPVTDPTEQAEIILKYRLPFPQVVSLVTNITPTVWVALIEVMSPQELLQQLGALERHGVTKNKDLKTLVQKKLKSAKSADKKRVDALKGAAAAKAVKGLDSEIAQAVTEVTDAQLKQHGEITATTALFIDKSSSMEEAIELGKELGAAIAQACMKGKPPVTYMFDSSPTQVRWLKKDGDITSKSAWDEKLKMFRANGGTDPASVIRALISKNERVEQILLVTDEGENSVGKFAEQMKKYEQKFGFMPNIVIARVGDLKKGYPWGASDRMEKSLKAAHIDAEVLDCTKADQVSIPNLVQLLSRKSLFDLVQEIKEIELPNREDWDRAHGLVA